MSLHNPFEWAKNPRPSIFLGQPGFPPAGDLTNSQKASAAVDRITARTGKNPGTLTGISNASRSQPIPDAWLNKARGVR